MIDARIANLRLERELDEAVARGIELIVARVEAGDPEAARWLATRDAEAIAKRFGADGLLDRRRLYAAVSRARRLVRAR